MKKRTPFYLSTVVIVAILSVSTASLFIRFAQQEAPSIVIAAIRMAFASLLLAPLAISKYLDEIISIFNEEFVLLILAGLFLAIHFATWITSLEYTSVVSSVVLVSTGPLWVAIFSPFFLQEKIARSTFLGLLITILGGAILALSDACTWKSGLLCPSLSSFIQGKAILGDSLALIGAVSVSGYLMIGRKVRVNTSLIPYIFIVYSIAAFFLIGYMVFIGQTPLGYPIQTYWWLFLLALFPQIIGHSAYNWILRYLPATIVAVITLGEPVGATILAFLAFHEIPGIIKLGGASTLLIGILITLSRQK